MSRSDIDDCGGLLEYNITKILCNRENRIMLWKYSKNFKIRFNLLLIAGLKDKAPKKIPASHVSFRHVHHRQQRRSPSVIGS